MPRWARYVALTAVDEAGVTAALDAAAVDSGGAAVKRTVTRSPPAGASSKFSSAPCRSATLRTIARPSPVPSWSPAERR